MLSIRKVIFKILCVAMFFQVMAANTYAATISLNFDAQVYEVNDPDNLLGSMLGLSVDLGDIFTAGYSMDSNPAFTYNGPGFPAIGTAVYTANTISTFANYEGTALNASTDIPSNMFIGNNYDGGNGDVLDAWRVLSEISPATATQPQISLGVILFSETGTRLTDNSFFVNDSLDGWDNAIFYAITNEGNILMLASNNIQPVPLPPALWLFGSGLMGMIGISGRRFSG